MNRSEFEKLEVQEGDALAILLKGMLFRCRFVSLAEKFDSDTIVVTSQDAGQPQLRWVFDLYDATAVGKVLPEPAIVATGGGIIL